MTKQKQNECFNATQSLYDGREFIIDAFQNGIFSLKSTTGPGLKILTAKQILQRLLIALEEAKAGNKSEN